MKPAMAGRRARFHTLLPFPPQTSVLMPRTAMSASPTRMTSFPSNTDAPAARRRPGRATTQPAVPTRHGSSGYDSAQDARRANTDPSGARPGPGVLKRMTTGLFTPERKVGKAPSFLASFKAAVLSSWM